MGCTTYKLGRRSACFEYKYEDSLIKWLLKLKNAQNTLPDLIDMESPYMSQLLLGNWNVDCIVKTTWLSVKHDNGSLYGYVIVQVQDERSKLL